VTDEQTDTLETTGNNLHLAQVLKQGHDDVHETEKLLRSGSTTTLLIPDHSHRATGPPPKVNN
jgi:hypothetical protein